jgi:hypothetical protein
VLGLCKDNNHFADAENNTILWERVWPAVFEHRRRILREEDAARGRVMNVDRGCFLYDAWTGFEAACGKTRRERIKRDHNLTSIQGDGKWSVHGSVCDFNHAHLRQLHDRAEAYFLGFSDDPAERQALSEFTFTDIGAADKDYSNPHDIIQVGLLVCLGTCYQHCCFVCEYGCVCVCVCVKCK